MVAARYGSTVLDGTLVLGELLGGGRRYEVYRAWDHLTASDVAVKVMRTTHVDDPRSREAFDREATIARTIQHPNLVRLLRRHDGARPYMVLELVAAPTLEEHLARHGAVGVPEACVLGRRILAALRGLHGGGIAHLDVKPANVTIGDPPRLLDLGSARAVPVTLGRRVGTVSYMSPEQRRGALVSTSADLFGLGVTLYEALTGVGPTAWEEEPPPITDLLPAIPLALAATIHACIASDARDRPDAATAAVELGDLLRSLGLARLTRTKHDAPED